MTNLLLLILIIVLWIWFSHIGDQWISVNDRLPEPEVKVYVVCENPKYGSYNGEVIRFQTIAQYIPYMTVKEEDFMHEEGDICYNEEEDQFYTPEGFYEWQSEPDINWKISAKVTHWQYLFELPNNKNK